LCIIKSFNPKPVSNFLLSALHVPFATAAAVAKGIKRALKAQGKQNINVIVWAGDGGTFDIGLQAISGAAERNEDFIYFCYDNEAYMNTGVQQSSATPPGASIVFPEDFYMKIKKSKDKKGFRFIHMQWNVVYSH